MALLIATMPTPIMKVTLLKTFFFLISSALSSFHIERERRERKEGGEWRKRKKGKEGREEGGEGPEKE